MTYAKQFTSFCFFSSHNRQLRVDITQSSGLCSTIFEVISLTRVARIQQISSPKASQNPQKRPKTSPKDLGIRKGRHFLLSSFFSFSWETSSSFMMYRHYTRHNLFFLLPHFAIYLTIEIVLHIIDTLSAFVLY